MSQWNPVPGETPIDLSGLIPRGIAKLANIWLKQMRQPITNWPEPTMGAESDIRKQYIDAIKSADGGDYSSLIDLHKCFAQRQ